MCGYYYSNNTRLEKTDNLKRRGPDEWQETVIPDLGYFGSARLTTLKQSTPQPVIKDNGVFLYNGIVYNNIETNDTKWISDQLTNNLNDNIELIKSLNGEYSLVKCMPYTGRSHQLRVHLDSVGNAIVGDKVYGEKRRKSKISFSDLTYSHHFLHAYSLTFPLKNGGAMTVCADYPKNFNDFVSKIRG